MYDNTDNFMRLMYDNTDNFMRRRARRCVLRGEKESRLRLLMIKDIHTIPVINNIYIYMLSNLLINNSSSSIVCVYFIFFIILFKSRRWLPDLTHCCT